MKKLSISIVTILVIYVIAYIPVSLTMGGYGPVELEGIGVKQRWCLYYKPANLLIRQRQVGMELLFFPLLTLDRMLVHQQRGIGIDVGD